MWITGLQKLRKKVVVLDLQKRMQIIEELKNKESKKKMADEYKVSVRTIERVIKKPRECKRSQ